MKHKIAVSSFLTREYLQVDDQGIKYCGTEAFRSVRRFRFDQVACVIMSPEHTLSFQVGQEVFSIRTNPNNAKHQAAIKALVQALEVSRPANMEAAAPAS